MFKPSNFLESLHLLDSLLLYLLIREMIAMICAGNMSLSNSIACFPWSQSVLHLLGWVLVEHISEGLISFKSIETIHITLCGRKIAMLEDAFL